MHLEPPGHPSSHSCSPGSTLIYPIPLAPRPTGICVSTQCSDRLLPQMVICPVSLHPAQLQPPESTHPHPTARSHGSRRSFLALPAVSSAAPPSGRPAHGSAG